MTFDIQEARAAMKRAKEKAGVVTDIDHLAALTYLPTALDEIERLQTVLVEERACLIEAGGEPVGKRLLDEDQKDLDGLAHEQLRQEGKL
jgi:hypothetical protein